MSDPFRTDARWLNDRRFRWLQKNYDNLQRQYCQKRGYRSTALGAGWEVWNEFEGWFVSCHDDQLFATMELAIDKALEEGWGDPIE